MNKEEISLYINKVWDSNVIPTLEKYIRIPNLSPMFEPEWQKSGNTEKAIHLIVEWVHSQNLGGAHLEVKKKTKNKNKKNKKQKEQTKKQKKTKKQKNKNNLLIRILMSNH